MLIRKYSTLKAASKVAFSKDGDTYILTEKQFDANTGEALSDGVTKVELSSYETDKSYLEAEKARIEADIAELDKIITDIKAL